MKAAVWHGKRDVRLEEVPEPPKPGPREVKVAVRWCGICGSDLHEYLSGPILIPTTPHPLTGRMAPLTLGHEFSGDVVEVGSEVKGIEVDDRVTVDAAIYCGECYWCKRNRYAICEKLAGVGLCTDGAFAKYVNVPSYCIYKLPAEISYEVAALIEPISVAIHAIRRSNLQEGDNAVVMGAGPIGLSALQAAKAAGAGQVLVVEMMESRRRLARELGATTVIDPREVDVQEEIFRLTGGIGADVGFECIGGAKTAPLLVELIRRGGRAVIVGVFEQKSEIDFNRVVFFEKEVIGSFAYNGEYAATIALLSDGRIKGEPLITAKIGLGEILEKGFQELEQNKEKHIKILVSPDL